MKSLLKKRGKWNQRNLIEKNQCKTKKKNRNETVY